MSTYFRTTHEHFETKLAFKKLYKNKADIILQVLFLVVMALCIWGIDIYRITIIELKYVFYAIVIGALLSLSLIPRFLKSSYSRSWIFLISIAIGCGLFYFGLLFINQKFASKENKWDDFPIVKTGTLARGRSSKCGQPFAVVDFYGIRKQLIFYCDYESTIRTYSKVKLSYSKGFFGFDVINSKELLR